MRGRIKSGRVRGLEAVHARVGPSAKRPNPQKCRERRHGPAVTDLTDMTGGREGIVIASGSVSNNADSSHIEGRQARMDGWAGVLRRPVLRAIRIPRDQLPNGQAVGLSLAMMRRPLPAAVPARDPQTIRGFFRHADRGSAHGAGTGGSRHGAPGAMAEANRATDVQRQVMIMMTMAKAERRVFCFID
ncbi:hypothetical protein ANO11243_005640 [Dothideomycetidae sp. 11243]|nr:hypothetical protein ANO11243_005640 [fungal sp. No.11243]